MNNPKQISLNDLRRLKVRESAYRATETYLNKTEPDDVLFNMSDLQKCMSFTDILGLLDEDTPDNREIIIKFTKYLFAEVQSVYRWNKIDAIQVNNFLLELTKTKYDYLFTSNEIHKNNLDNKKLSCMVMIPLCIEMLFLINSTLALTFCAKGQVNKSKWNVNYTTHEMELIVSDCLSYVLNNTV